MICRLLWKVGFHLHVYSTSATRITTLIPLYPPHTTPPSLFQIRFNNISDLSCAFEVGRCLHIFLLKFSLHDPPILFSSFVHSDAYLENRITYSDTHNIWSTTSFNHLKPTGYVTHHQFNIQQLYALPTLYLCVLYLSENKQRLVPLTA